MRLGLFTDAFAEWPLGRVLDWLEEELPGVRDLEIGVGGYSPAPHVGDLAELQRRGFRLAALNASGNPLEEPAHDAALRRALELAREHGVERVVCMSGGEPRLAGGGWFPGVETEVERYWQERVLPYWDGFADADGVRLCFELEPGAAVYNASTFERLADLGPALAVNLDPSHFFWQAIDPLAAVRRFGERIGWAHGKDTVLDGERVPVDGLLDRTAWRYATVGHGHGADWWRLFVDELAGSGYEDVLSIEWEDDLVEPQRSVPESARALEAALGVAT